MPADPDVLKSVPFFQTLDDDERSAVAALMHDERIPASTTLFRESDPGGVLYIINQGKVELSVIGEDGKKVTVDLLEAGEFFGEVSLLDGGGRTATAVAREDVQVFRLEREPVLNLLRRPPDAALDLL